MNKKVTQCLGSVVPLATFATDDHVLLFIQLLEQFCRTRECDCGRGRESLEVEQLGGRQAGWARGPAAAAAQVAAGQEWREWERRGRETRVQLNQADEPRTSKNDLKTLFLVLSDAALIAVLSPLLQSIVIF